MFELDLTQSIINIVNSVLLDRWPFAKLITPSMISR